MRTAVFMLALAACTGDDGPGKLPDAPLAPDAAPDAPMCAPATGSGTIHQSASVAETWTAAGSPHKLTADLSITAAITIEACAVVQIGGDKSIVVRQAGSLTAAGMPGLPVTIERLDPTNSWASISTIGGPISLTYTDVKGAVHTYSNVLACKELGLDPALEPTYGDALRNPDWNMCQYGIRVYDEFLQQMNVQAGGDATVVPHYVTEWNSLVGRVHDDLADPAWPCNNYPAGLLENAVDYLKLKPNLIGFAMFVDSDAGGESPFWVASSARGYLRPADLDEQQQARLRD